MVVIAGSVPHPHAPWEAGHFVGGHPVLDLANTVYNRTTPLPDNDLLATPALVLSWARSVGLVDGPVRLTDAAGRALLTGVHEVREQTWAVFDAVSRDEQAPADQLGGLLARAGSGVRSGDVEFSFAGNHVAVHAIPAALALLAVQAYFTLPAERVRSCGRCGWLFLDSSRGGRRRWCSMSTCGNREKASRHRNAVS